MIMSDKEYKAAYDNALLIDNYPMLERLEAAHTFYEQPKDKRRELNIKACSIYCEVH